VAPPCTRGFFFATHFSVYTVRRCQSHSCNQLQPELLALSFCPCTRSSPFCLFAATLSLIVSALRVALSGNRLRPPDWHAAFLDQPSQFGFGYAHAAAYVKNGEPSNGDPVPNCLWADIECIREFRYLEVPHNGPPLLHFHSSWPNCAILGWCSSNVL
jgi:hypothetical protein